MSCRAALWEPNVERKPPRGGEAWPGSAGRHLLSAKAKSALGARRVSWLGRPSAIADGPSLQLRDSAGLPRAVLTGTGFPLAASASGREATSARVLQLWVKYRIRPGARQAAGPPPPAPSPRRTALLHVEEIGRGESRPQTRASSTARFDHPCARRERSAASLVEDSVVTDTGRSRGWMNPEDARRLRRLTDLPSRDTSHGNSSRSMQHVSKRSW
jgi:hypothetical protein